MNPKDLFIFIGAPGSGKGSLSRLCVDELGLTQLSTGFLCRKHIAEKTPIGEKIDLVINSGKLIPDNMILDMVKQWLGEHINSVQGIILDGFPRTGSQAEALQNLIEQQLPNFTVNVVKLAISNQAVTQRLLNRSICQNQNCQAVYSTAENSRLRPKKDGICDRCSSPLRKRDDDAEAVIAQRLHDYNDQERELMSFYADHGVNVVTINVEQPLESVFEEFKQHFGY